MTTPNHIFKNTVKPNFIPHNTCQSCSGTLQMIGNTGAESCDSSHANHGAMNCATTNPLSVKPNFIPHNTGSFKVSKALGFTSSLVKIACQEQVSFFYDFYDFGRTRSTQPRIKTLLD